LPTSTTNSVSRRSSGSDHRVSRTRCRRLRNWRD